MASIDYPLERPQLEDEGWHFAENLYAWIATVDHKRLGLMYIVSALIFLGVAGVMAAVIRLQLAFPNGHVVGPDTYNRLFTMHGTTMVFLVGMPMVAGFSNYLVPIMIGARDMAFPRLNSFGFWIFLFGGLLLYFSYIGGERVIGCGFGARCGMVCLCSAHRQSVFTRHAARLLDPGCSSCPASGALPAQSTSSLLPSLMRCPGMTLSKMPMFVWVMLIDSWLILVALPPLSAGQIMLLLDRFLGANFFNTQARRLGRSLAAFFLDLRASGGLHPDFPGIRDPLRSYSRFFAQAAISAGPRWWARLSRSGLSAWVFGRIICLRSECPRGRIRFLRRQACWWEFRRASKFSTGPPPCTAEKSICSRPCSSAAPFCCSFW